MGRKKIDVAQEISQAQTCGGLDLDYPQGRGKPAQDRVDDGQIIVPIEPADKLRTAHGKTAWRIKSVSEGYAWIVPYGLPAPYRKIAVYYIEEGVRSGRCLLLWSAAGCARSLCKLKYHQYLITNIPMTTRVMLAGNKALERDLTHDEDI